MSPQIGEFHKCTQFILTFHYAGQTQQNPHD